MGSIKTKAPLRARFFHGLRDHGESLLLVFLMALILRWFFVGSYRADSEVMEPTLTANDIFFGLKLPFGWNNPLTGTRWLAGRPPHLGELVVFDCGRGQLCLRRVIGVPGDRVELWRQRLRINDVECQYDLYRRSETQAEIWEKCNDYKWLIRWSSKESSAQTWAASVVPPKQVLVAGDWRSADGAAPLLIPVESLRAAVWRIWMSWSEGSLETPRIGMRPH